MGLAEGTLSRWHDWTVFLGGQPILRGPLKRLFHTAMSKLKGRLKFRGLGEREKPKESLVKSDWWHFVQIGQCKQFSYHL